MLGCIITMIVNMLGWIITTIMVITIINGQVTWTMGQDGSWTWSSRLAARAPLRNVGPKLMVMLANLGIVKVVRRTIIVKIAIIKKVGMIISHTASSWKWSFEVQKYNRSKAHHIMKTPKPTHWLLSLGSLWSLSREHYETHGVNTKDKMLKEEKLTLWWNQCPQLLLQVKWGRRSEQLSRGSLWTPWG